MIIRMEGGEQESPGNHTCPRARAVCGRAGEKVYKMQHPVP